MLLKRDTSVIGWVFLNLVSGLGLGILYPAMSNAAQGSAKNSDLATAAALFSFFRALGQSIGVAIGGVVFQNSLIRNLSSNPDPTLVSLAQQYGRDASALVQQIRDPTSNLANYSERLIVAYVDALRRVWLVMCILSAVALIASLVGTKDLSLDRAHEPEQPLELPEHLHRQSRGSHRRRRSGSGRVIGRRVTAVEVDGDGDGDGGADGVANASGTNQGVTDPNSSINKDEQQQQQQ